MGATLGTTGRVAVLVGLGLAAFLGLGFGPGSDGIVGDRSGPLLEGYQPS